jgi:hypothetical protein
VTPPPDRGRTGQETNMKREEGTEGAEPAGARSGERSEPGRAEAGAAPPRCARKDQGRAPSSRTALPQPSSAAWLGDLDCEAAAPWSRGTPLIVVCDQNLTKMHARGATPHARRGLRRPEPDMASARPSPISVCPGQGPETRGFQRKLVTVQDSRSCDLRSRELHQTSPKRRRFRPCETGRRASLIT